MAVSTDLPASPGRTVLLAASLASQADVSGLRRLFFARRDILRPAVVLAVVLRFLPESTSVEEYADFVREAAGVGRPGGAPQSQEKREEEEEKETDSGAGASFVAGVSEASAVRTLEGLGFAEYLYWTDAEKTATNTDTDTDADAANVEMLREWVQARARAIDRETGAIELADALVARFIEDSAAVYAWYVGVVTVLRRVVYASRAARRAHSVGGVLECTLEEFERLNVRDGVRLLLDVAVAGDGGGREGGEVGATDIDVGGGFALVGDYLRYCARDGNSNSNGDGSGWRHVWEWLVERARGGEHQFGVVWRVVRGWEGPDDDAGAREGYLRATMAACYTCRETDEETVQQLRDVVHRVAGRVGVDVGAVRGEEVDALVDGFMVGRGSVRDAFGRGSAVDGDRGEVEGEDEAERQVATPTAAALRLLEMLVVSVGMFAVFPLRVTVREAMRMRFSGSREDQMGLLRRALRGDGRRQRGEAAYAEVRAAGEYLRQESGVLGLLGWEDIEVEVFRDILANARFTDFKGLKAMYIGGGGAKPLLAREVVEKVVAGTALDFYDRSTNGNRTRGSMKNASNVLAVIYPQHSKAPALRRLAALLAATHALSEYSLTLTPGTPLKPVQVRLYPDPPELIARVLQANPKAYLQLDSLVTIAADLVYGVSRDGDDDSHATVDQAALKSRVTGMCVEAALAEDDFETAFSYVVNKLVPHHQKTRAASGGSAVGYTYATRDTAWQAALQAGRYRSPAMLLDDDDAAAAAGEVATGAGTTTGAAIERVQKRMELLSQALVICPAEAMGDVLRSWRGCEEELDVLLERETVEERAHAGKLRGWSLGIPGVLAAADGAGILGKAPMSLLGVASSAGNLLRSSAFPLAVAGGAGAGAVDADGRSGSVRGSGEYERGEDGERTRKRDVLSGMVTSGLASGLGWVLGAKPGDRNSQP